MKNSFQKQLLTDKEFQVEHILKESDEIYRLISENTNELIRILDNKFIIQYINEEAHSRILGYSKQELLGKSVKFIIHPDEKKQINEFLREIIKNGESKREGRLIHKEGHGIWFDIRGKLFKDSQGNLYGLLISRDITEKKEYELELKQSKEKFRLISENMNDIVLILNSKFKIEYINERALKKILGYLKEDMVYKMAIWFAHPEDRERLLNEFKKIFDGKEVITEGRIKHKTGKYIWVEFSGNLFHDENNNPKFHLITRDISEKKKTEIKLNQSIEKYQKLIKTSPASIVLLDSRGKIIECNNITREFLSGSDTTLIGKKFYNLESLKDRTQWANEIFTKIKNGELEEPINFNFTNKNGKTYFLNCSFSILKMGNKDYIQVVSHNITSHKKAETLIKKEIEKLRELDQIKNDLIQRIAHELRTPLTSIYSGSEFLLNYYRDKMDATTQKFLKLINLGGFRLKELFDNLLLSFDIESENYKLQFQNCDLISIIEKSIQNVAQMASRRKVLINKNLHDNLYLTIDKFKLEKAISNILFNAVQNTLKHGIVRVNTKQNLNYIEITIEDTGIGFTKAEKKKLFKKFGKIERYGKGMDIDTEGLGLGLYNANRIIESHGGMILFESKGRYKGSTFILRLPFKNHLHSKLLVA